MIFIKILEEEDKNERYINPEFIRQLSCVSKKRDVTKIELINDEEIYTRQNIGELMDYIESNTKK